MPKSCPFTLSQGEFGYESVKLMGALVLLVTFTVWGATEAAEPPTWPEKVNVGLSTTSV
jgi:hypothetical protein